MASSPHADADSAATCRWQNLEAVSDVPFHLTKVDFPFATPTMTTVTRNSSGGELCTPARLGPRSLNPTPNLTPLGPY